MKNLNYIEQKWINAFKNPVFARYLVGGVEITGINLSLFAVLIFAGCRATRANLIALCVAKVSGFFINKYYVYRVYDQSFKRTGREVGKYIVARLLTGILDYYALVLLIDIWGLPIFFSKYTVMGCVIILNYLFGKYFVFVKSSIKVRK